MFLRDATPVKGSMSVCRKRVGVQCDERVRRFDLFQGVVEREEAGKVSSVCYERGPDCSPLIFFCHIKCEMNTFRRVYHALLVWICAIHCTLRAFHCSHHDVSEVL